MLLMLGGGIKYCLCSSPIWGNDFNLTHIFQMDVGPTTKDSSEKIQSFQAMKLFLAPPGHREDLQGAFCGVDETTWWRQNSIFWKKEWSGAVSSSLKIANWVYFPPIKGIRKLHWNEFEQRTLYTLLGNSIFSPLFQGTFEDDVPFFTRWGYDVSSLEG